MESDIMPTLPPSRRAGHSRAAIRNGSTERPIDCATVGRTTRRGKNQHIAAQFCRVQNFPYAHKVVKLFSL